jgi:hypothetical protein
MASIRMDLGGTFAPDYFPNSRVCYGFEDLSRSIRHLFISVKVALNGSQNSFSY